ncbi:MAG: NAD-dependent epimerase/dehydratase [Candidatus Scalindua rubra]|uniref:NAD-dependent epimerase/dehydratase n=1 Tax=Candidatus Scalindua rubra TaxID=1872076 RepID=A0A1E3X688_9BACT|nr:MAG: NAD-dependent epimerase/dehydratase [Candidatus Scalindua rubra]
MNQPVLAELIDRCDMVYHLTAAVGVKLIVESPVRTIETNINGTDIVLKLSGKKRKKVMVFSSSEVYGKGNQIPFREDYDIVLGSTQRARWCFACPR